MTTAYTSLLGLALPVTGELSGTWGDTVNTAITSLLDTAIAGTTSITTDADITLTTTTGASNQARQAILLWNPASGTTTRYITAPAQSKLYTVINASGGTQSIVIRGAGPTTGVTIAKGESAMVAWNGSDFVKVSSSGGAITFTDLTVTGNTILGDAAADTLTVNATSTFAAPVNFTAQVKLPSTGRSAAAALTPTNPAFLYGVASTYTDTTSSGTLAPVAAFYGFAQPTLSTSNVTTYTTAATLYIANAPAAAGSATITNPYALYIAAGNAYFGDSMVLGSSSADTATINATITSNLLFTDNTYDIGASGATRPRNLYLAGAAVVGGNTTLGDASADTLTVNATITSNLIFTDNTYDIGASGATRPRNMYLANDLVVTNKITTLGSPMIVGDGTSNASAPAEIQLNSGTSSKYSDIDYNVAGVLKWRVGMNGGDRMNIYGAGLGNIAWWDNSTGYFVQQQGLTVSKNTAGTRPFITIDNASSDGGVGTGQYFTNSGTGAKYNWILGTQVVTNDAIEFVPSTAAGGATYTSPVLTLYPAQQVTVNGNTITNSARLTVHGGPVDPSVAGTGFSYVAEGAYGGGFMLRDGNYTWGIYDNGGNFKIGNGTTTGALTGRFNLTTGGVGMFGAGPNTSYTPSYGLGTYKGAAQNNALLINVDNGYNAYVNFSSYSAANSFGYNYGASQFQWASADGFGSNIIAKLGTSGTLAGNFTLNQSSFASLAGSSSGLQLIEGGGTFNAQYALIGNSYNYIGVTGPGALLYNYGGDMNFATDPAGGSSFNWSVGGARKLRLTSSALESYQNVSVQVTSGTPGVSLNTPGRSSKYIIPWDYGDVAQNTWYTVWTFSYAYTGTFFMLLLGYENNGGDGQNATAIFVSAANGAYAGGNQPTRLTGATGLECQIVSGSGGTYLLQVRRTYDSASSGNNYKAMLMLLQGE